MKLCCYILGILFISVFGNCEIPTEVKRIMDECEKEFGVTQDFVLQHSDDPKVKCYHACTFKKDGSMANGKIVIEKTLEVSLKYIADAAMKNFLKGAITECANLANDEKEECDVGVAFSKCIVKKIVSYNP